MNESEWRTRKQRIDTKLRALTPQWEIIPYCKGLNVWPVFRYDVERAILDGYLVDYEAVAIKSISA